MIETNAKPNNDCDEMLIPIMSLLSVLESEYVIGDLCGM